MHSLVGVDPFHQPWVEECDPVLLGQVLANLLENVAPHPRSPHRAERALAPPDRRRAGGRHLTAAAPGERARCARHSARPQAGEDCGQ